MGRKIYRIKKRSRIKQKEQKVGSLFQYSNVASAVGEMVGETIVILELIKNKIVPYPKFIDVDGVDIVTKYKSRDYFKINHKPQYMTYGWYYYDIQVKYSKKDKYGKYFFNITRFQPRYSYYFVFVCENYKNIFVIDSTHLAKFMGKTKGTIKIVLEDKEWFLKTKEKKFKINEFLRNYKPLKYPNAILA